MVTHNYGMVTCDGGEIYQLASRLRESQFVVACLMSEERLQTYYIQLKGNLWKGECYLAILEVKLSYGDPK